MACDPNFGDVVLLLHFDGANGQTTFTDSSSLNSVMTSNDGAALSTAQAMFGPSSLAITTTSVPPDQAVTTPISIGGANDIFQGGGDFTIEGWFWYSSSPGIGAYLCAVDYGSSSFSDYGLVLLVDPFQMTLIPPQSRPSWSELNPSVSISTNTWHSFAVTKAGSTVFLFLDGNIVGSNNTWTGTATFNPSPFIWVGGSPAVTGAANPGYVDEVRITKGLARYTADYTPSATEFGVACLFPVPDILGDLPAAADAAIVGAGLAVGTIGLPVPSALYPTGTVATQYPLAGVDLSPGGLVNYALSLGSGGATVYGKFIAAPAVLDAIVVANIGDIEPKVWPPVSNQTFRSGS